MFHLSLGSVAKGKDWVIIDGPPQVKDIAISAIKAADLVLIPVQPSPYDIWAAEGLVELIKERQEISNGRPRAAFLISRAIKRTTLSSGVRDALARYQLPVIQAQVTQRVIYPSTAARGSTVLEEDPDSDAAREIREMLTEVKTLLR